MSVQISGLNKRFGSFQALHEIDLTIETGELVALLGPSGSGKTTLLRIIAGLEGADSGAIQFYGEDATARAARDRGIGFVFQHYALFRHMTVFENVAFGLRVRPRKTRPAKDEIARRVHELLSLVQLDWASNRYPDQLSGGQRQRIALARALATEPKVLLLDEPFGALDAKVRQELRQWLRRFHDEVGVTTIFVTHDQEEALEVADRVVIMNQGRIEQVGTADQVYEQPANPFVFSFLGNVNLFHGRVQDGQARIGSLELKAPEHLAEEGLPVVAYARPHELEVETTPVETCTIEGVLRHANPVGRVVRLELQRIDNDELILAEVPKERWRELGVKVGDIVFCRPRNLQLFAADWAF
ncbi:MAG TPA: sulfate ABC transporter ATP-binding protein [Symbiobacteriaceae bacterium]|nr:sulfate ABC transporter ATP-binding protein [Symbiobacteriaceae bacterium]